MNRTLLFTLFLTIFLACAASAQQPKPNTDELNADATRLDQLQKVFESDRIWAREMQTEFEASNMQEMVRKYSKSK